MQHIKVEMLHQSRKIIHQDRKIMHQNRIYHQGTVTPYQGGKMRHQCKK